MWLVDLLQKTVPHLGAATDAQVAVDVARIRDIRMRLLKHAKTGPGGIVRKSDDGLVDALCMLRLDLDALPEAHALRSDPDSRSAIETIYAELDRLLGEDVSFDESQTLDGALERLTDTADVHARRRQGRKLAIRRMSMLITVIPLLGYGVHWTLGNFYRQALIDDVDIVYPQKKFAYVDDRYQLRDVVEKASLEDFREYYFRDTTPDVMGMRNPLPLAFDVESAAALGIELSDEINQALESGVIGLGAIDTNLFIFRVFVRNIRDNNMVNNLRVRAERIDDGAFSWRQMDVDTEIEFANGVGNIGGPLKVAVRTTRTPVLNMSLDIRLEPADRGVDQVFHKDLGVLISDVSLTPEFGAELIRADPERPVFVLLSSGRASNVALDPAHRRTYEETVRDIDRIEGYIAEHGYVFFECAEDSVAVLARSQTLRQLFGVEAVGAIEIDYTYQRLDGVDRSGHQSLALEQPVLRLREGLSAGLEELEQCVQYLVYYYGLPEAVEVAAAGPDSWLSGLDRIALMLADTPAQKAPVIAAEETLLLDFEDRLNEVERGVTEIHILKDGEYVLFTVVATNFRGGNHRFVFFFDEEPVAELTAALQWPQSLRFKTDDVALFNSDPDAGAGPQ